MGSGHGGHSETHRAGSLADPRPFPITGSAKAELEVGLGDLRQVPHRQTPISQKGREDLSKCRPAQGHQTGQRSGRD